MMKRNKLYTVNKWNQTAFMPEKNIFGIGGAIIPQGQGNFANYGYGNIGSGLSQTPNIQSQTTTQKAAPNQSMGQLFGAAGAAIGNVKTGDSRGMWDTADPVYHLAGGRESAAGNAMSDAGVSLAQTGNPWLMLAGAGLKVVGGLTNAAFGIKTDKERLGSLNSSIGGYNNFRSDASSFDGVANIQGNVSADGIYKGGWFSGGKARRKQRDLEKRLAESRGFAERSIDNNIGNISDDQISGALGNFAAYGGPLGYGLNTGGALGLMQQNNFLDAMNRRTDALARDNSQMLKPTGVLRAFGGELGTNGTDWTNGLLYVDAGSSHENNPLGGVPMGVDEEGVPNLVEEGETVWNDYVFSDRIKVPKGLQKELGLGGVVKKDVTFAEASKKMAKESEQRPNDPISMAGLDAGLGKLAEIQEAERMKQQMKEYVGLDGYACGGKLGRKYDGTENHSQQLRKYGYYTNGSDGLGTPTGFKVGRNGRAYDYTDAYRNLVNRLTADDIRAWAAAHPDDPSLKSFIARGNDLSKLTDEQWRTGATDGKYGFMHHVAEQLSHEPTEEMTEEQFRSEYPMIARPTDREPVTTNWTDGSVWQGLSGAAPQSAAPSQAAEHRNPVVVPKSYWTDLRYAPAIGAGIMSLTDALGLTNKPDYTYADKLEAAANSAGYAPNVTFDPIGNYLTYRPMDIWYEQNRMDANARATDRNLLNTSGGNRGTAMAGLIANGYNSQIADGNLYRQALEYNDAKRERVEDFNRRTDMFNSQMGLEAAMANARYNQQAGQYQLSGLAQAAALRDGIDARVGAAKAANLTNLFNSLGDIGRENMSFNMLNSTSAAHNGYWIDKSGNVHYTSEKKRSGGRIRRSK